MIAVTTLLWLSTSAASPACSGETDAKARELKVSVEGGDLFKFSVKRFGAPKKCSIHWQAAEGQSFGTMRYDFAHGESFTWQSSPPETLVTTIEAPSGLGDEAGLRQFLQTAPELVQADVDWKKAPETESDADAGTTTQTFWAKGDFNAGIDLTRKGGKVIALRFHMAL